MSLAVREAGVADAAALREIRLEALVDSPGAYGTTYADVAHWTIEQWRESLVPGHFLGEVDGRVRGMARGGTHGDFPGELWLFGMYVGPDARGLGLADLLVDAVEDWARERGGRTLHLAVALEMTRAVSFYRRRGFYEVGEVRYMSRDGATPIQTMVERLD